MIKTQCDGAYDVCLLSSLEDADEVAALDEFVLSRHSSSFYRRHPITGFEVAK